MNTTETLADAQQERADAEAVMAHFISGQPLDPEVSTRVRARATKITQEIWQMHGLIDDDTFQSLLSSAQGFLS